MTLVETPSGLVVPESALPPPPSTTDLSGTFDTKDAAEKWVTKCVVRWDWAIGLINVNEGKDEDPKWRAHARRTSGQIHNTTMESYVKSSEDRPLAPYVDVVKETTTDENRPVVYRVVNKQ